ncbi:MAG: hypothetical protein JW866_01390 [Ignavibacteriales bacterium]|nr:hypothetical protein [Ignavibacteriales bacterium]
MRNKKSISIFNFSYLDIMTVLLIISLILLFSIASLFSFLPYQDKFLNELVLKEDANKRLIKNFEDKKSILASYNIRLNEEIDKNRKILHKTRLTIYDMLNIKYEELSSKEKTDLNSLPKQIEDANVQIRELKKQVGVFRSSYVKRRNEWVQQMMVTDTQISQRINQIPIFYKVDNSGMIDFETGNMIRLDQIIEKHNPIKDVSYPLFIVEKSGFRFFNNMLQNIQNLAIQNKLRIGYEPYNKDLDVIYEVFDIAKP